MLFERITERFEQYRLLLNIIEGKEPDNKEQEDHPKIAFTP